jgi:hypothetical protein
MGSSIDCQSSYFQFPTEIIYTCSYLLSYPWLIAIYFSRLMYIADPKDLLSARCFGWAMVDNSA